MDDLVGVREITERLGLARPQVVYNWRNRYADFPEPVAVVSSTTIWRWPEVQRWATKAGFPRGTDRSSPTAKRGAL